MVAQEVAVDAVALASLGSESRAVCAGHDRVNSRRCLHVTRASSTEGGKYRDERGFRSLRPQR
jgi:hypothetical protein